MLTTLPAVMNPGFEAALRTRCLVALDHLPTPDDSFPDPARLTELLRQGTHCLELLVVLTATTEAVRELGIETYGDLKQRAADVQRRVAAATHLDVGAVLQSARQYAPSSVPADDEPIRTGLQRLKLLVRTVTASCPTDLFDDLASFFTLPEWGYRFHVAYEALRSFLRRHNPKQREPLLIVGRYYQQGALEIGDVATLLDESIPDSVVLLEEHGFGRTVDTIALHHDARAQRLEKIREDRLRRGGLPAYSKELVRRSTIASERIEGVDARPWLGVEADRDRGR